MTTHPVLGDYLVQAVIRHRDRPALVDREHAWTFQELLAQARSVARYLQDLGAGAGSPIALMLGNRAEYAIADLAIALLGSAKVPLNTMLSPQEQAFILRDCGAIICVADRPRLAAFDYLTDTDTPPEVIVIDDDSWASATSQPPLTSPGPVDSTDRALIMYTGGTTGNPKGVVHTQGSMAANLLSHLLEMDLQEDDTLLLTSPLPHSAGFLMQAAFTRGATVYLEEKFDAAAVAERIERDRITYLFLVPTMIYRLLDEISARKDFDGSSIRTIMYGAAPITTDRLRQGLATFGQVFLQIYAQSEAPNFLTRLRRDDHRVEPEYAHRLRSCGQSVLMADVRIRNDNGSQCGPGEVGEVTARTPYTMTGYLGRPAETTDALRDGWLYTGDLGYVDEDGFVFLVDRKKDMIVTGGLNVYSAEVERALTQLPEVQEASVIGMPHPDWGEAVVAYIVARPGTAPTPDSVLASTRDQISAYKRPKSVVVVDRLPMTAVGKIDKKRLQEWWPGW